MWGPSASLAYGSGGNSKGIGTPSSNGAGTPNLPTVGPNPHRTCDVFAARPPVLRPRRTTRSVRNLSGTAGVGGLDAKTRGAFPAHVAARTAGRRRQRRHERVRT